MADPMVPANDPRLLDIVTLSQAVRRSMTAASKSNRAWLAAVSKRSVDAHYEAYLAHLRQAVELIQAFTKTGKYVELPSVEEKAEAARLAAAGTFHISKIPPFAG